MTQPFLTYPTMAYKASYIAAQYEALAHDGRKPRWHFDKLATHFDEYVATLLARRDAPLPGEVPQTEYWLIVDQQYAGSIGLRHALTPALLRYGGHIGYDIRPSMRRKGYGTVQCRLALAEAAGMGLARVLITCDDNNIGSIKIIEANGGVLENKVDNGLAALTRRYWVDLTARNDFFGTK